MMQRAHADHYYYIVMFFGSRLSEKKEQKFGRHKPFVLTNIRTSQCVSYVPITAHVKYTYIIYYICSILDSSCSTFCISLIV